MTGVVTRKMVDAGMVELPTEFIGEMTDQFWRDLIVRIYRAMADAQEKPGPKNP